MKNILLVDFSKQTPKYVNYAIQFLSKIKDAELELVNLHNDENALVNLNVLKNDFQDASINVTTLHIDGDITVRLPKHIKEDHVGFVFCGTHDLSFMDRIFSSEALDLFHEIDSNFVFLPESIGEFKPIKHVLAPIMSNKHSVQEIQPLLFLKHFMDFDLTLCTYSGENEGQKTNLYVATKILNDSDIPYSIKYIGDSESDLMHKMEDFSEALDINLISVVDFSEDHLFNMGPKGFIEDIIRNRTGIPVIALQNKQLEFYSSFHTTGGY
jgi:hypothetical protein